MSLQIKKEAYISPSCLGFLPAGSNNLQKVTVSRIIGKQHPCNSKQQRIKDKGKYDWFFFPLDTATCFYFYAITIISIRDILWKVLCHQRLKLTKKDWELLQTVFGNYKANSAIRCWSHFTITLIWLYFAIFSWEKPVFFKCYLIYLNFCSSIHQYYFLTPTTASVTEYSFRASLRKGFLYSHMISLPIAQTIPVWSFFFLQKE